MRSPERIQPPKESKKGTKEAEGEYRDGLKETHYSQKTSHANRSVANDPHKRSDRRGNY